MKSFNKFRESLLESRNLLDRFKYREKTITITNSFDVYADNQLIAKNFNDLEEAREYAISHIDCKKIVESKENIVPEEKVAALIKKHHNVNKITQALIESYIDMASSNTYSIDPVLNELNEKNIVLSGKVHFTLNDNSTVAIDEHTQKFLCSALEDKYQIIEYMRESKDNFMHVIRELKEE